MQRNHTQAGASKLGSTTNLMEYGLIETKEFSLTRTGSNFGMFPSLEISNGVPFRTMILLRRYPLCGVKWYSSLYNGASDAFCPTHEIVLLTLRKNELCLWIVFPCTTTLRFKLFLTLRMNSVRLLKLIRSRVTPACKMVMMIVKNSRKVDNQISLSKTRVS